MDTSKLAHPKPRAAALDRKDRRSARKAQDEAENKKVRQRSGGRCEVVDYVIRVNEPKHPYARCWHRAAHIHHRIGGWGKRARGTSILAENKLHVCADCHRLIHAHVLVPEGDSFRRVK